MTETITVAFIGFLFGVVVGYAAALHIFAKIDAEMTGVMIDKMRQDMKQAKKRSKKAATP